MITSCQNIAQFIKDNTTLEIAQTLIPELKELTENWDHLAPLRKGELIGSIIGEYGTDFLLIAAVTRGASLSFRGMKGFIELRRANAALTLERLAFEAATSGGTKPKGIPPDCIIELSEKNGGMVYRKLGTTKDQCVLVRVMPGDPNSPNLMQRKPYVIQRSNKKYYTLDGWIEEVGPETHIPLEKFEFKEWYRIWLRQISYQRI